MIPMKDIKLIHIPSNRMQIMNGGRYCAGHPKSEVHQPAYIPDFSGYFQHLKEFKGVWTVIGSVNPREIIHSRSNIACDGHPG
jgi:hypothetical protein